MANLLSNLGDLSIHRLLMGSHGVNLEVSWLMDAVNVSLVLDWVDINCAIMFSKWAVDG